MKLIYCDFVAGCFGGACGILVGHPLDTIKTCQQASNIKIGRSMYEIIVHNNGLRGFYRGSLFPLLATGGINSVLFGIYGNQLRILQSSCANENERKNLLPKHIFIAGSIAGMAQSFLACPIELVKIRMQTRACSSQGSLACLKNIVAIEGLRGLYRGLTPMICRDIFPYGIYMLAYQHILLEMLGETDLVREERKANRLKNNNSVNNNLELIITSICGAVAGVLSWVIVIPFDVIKTIMQAEPNPNTYKNMVDCMRVNIEKSGWKILFRGSWMLLGRAIPVNAATFIGYEACMENFKNIIN